VFEYGSGSSTIFLARHCAQVISVEHDGNWATRVQTALDRLSISNCQLRRVVPEPIGTAADTIGYTSGFEGCEQLAFRRYASAIDDQDDHSLDVVLIDGRAREACLRHADRKLRPGGFLIVDNTERPRYRAALERLPSDWLRIDFPGPCAHTDFFTRTTVWILPTHTGD
jgi:predicted O-methyltransferase YrrM